MDVEFVVRPDGVIDAVVCGLDLFNHALADSVSSRAPRGAAHQGLSTYWIDRTEQAARHAAAHGVPTPFAAGNVTYLRLDGDLVVASYDFDETEQNTESLPLAEFLGVLREWRRQVAEAGGATGEAAAEMVDERRSRPMPPRSE